MAIDEEIEEAAISIVESEWGWFWHQLPEATKHSYRYVAKTALERAERVRRELDNG